MNLKRKPYRPIPADPSIKCSYCLMEKNMSLLLLGKAQICDRHIISFNHNRAVFKAESRQRAGGDMVDLDADQDLINNETEERQHRDYPRGKRPDRRQ